MAAADAESPHAAEALETLCRAYWYPVYAWIRRHGRGPEEAQDLTQGFFALLLARKALARLDRARGRFRWFVLAALKNFLADERDRGAAQKRGGGVPVLSLDEQDAEGRYLREPAEGESPDRLFERRWAMSVLDQGLERLREEFALGGRGDWYERLKPFIAGDGAETSYADLARLLGATEGAVKMAVQRARRRLREILRSVLSTTVVDGAEVDDEMRALVEALRG